MNRASLLSITFGSIVLAAGLLNGIRVDRWSALSDVPEFAAHLNAVPADLVDWHGVPEPINDGDRVGHLKNHVSYRYQNSVTGDKVLMLLVCGRAGPISVHNPEVCYGGAGFEAVGKAFHKEIMVQGGRHISVAAMRFKPPPTLNASQLEVCWAWNGGNGWEAPENPRWDLAHYSVLYKLYVVRDVSANPVDENRDPTVSFMGIMLPYLERALAY
jgi:Protein of unknown function (DUF3485)